MVESIAESNNGRAHSDGAGGDNGLDRRQTPAPTSPGDVLQQIPGRVLLDRLPTPMIGFAEDGEFVYANPACAAMLGYSGVPEILEKTLPSLLVEHSHVSNADCLAMLRDAEGKVVDWRHTEGFPIHTAPSSPLLLRADDSVLLINLTDITELLWLEASRTRRP